MIDWTQPLYIDRISLLRGPESVTWVDDGEFHHIGDREFRYVYRGDGSRIKWLIAGVVTVCAGITVAIVRAWI